MESTGPGFTSQMGSASTSLMVASQQASFSATRHFLGLPELCKAKLGKIPARCQKLDAFMFASTLEVSLVGKCIDHSTK